MREPRIINVRRDQAVKRDLHQQITVELAEGPQRVARALWSDVSLPQPRDQRMKVPRSHESRHEFQRRPLLGREIISDCHLTSLPDRKSHQKALLRHRRQSTSAANWLRMRAALGRSPQAPSVRVSNAALDGRVELVMSPALLAEIADVLSRLGSGSGSRPKMLLKYRYRDSNR